MRWQCVLTSYRGMNMDDGKNSFTPQINYELLVEEALRSVVRSSLRIAQEMACPVKRISSSPSSPPIPVFRSLTGCVKAILKDDHHPPASVLGPAYGFARSFQ